MRDAVKYGLGITLVAVIIAFGFLIGSFSGTDDIARQIIKGLAPDFEAWFQPVWEPSQEQATVIFSITAAIGALIIGYFIGYQRAKRKFGIGGGD